MFDIKWIRENPGKFDAGLGLRGLEAQSAVLLELDDQRRAHVSKLQEAQESRNQASKAIGKAKASGDEETAQKAIEEVAKLKGFLQSAEEEERRLSDVLKDALAVIPNLPFDDIPHGTDESDNVEVRQGGEKPQFDFAPKEHFELGEALGQMKETPHTQNKSAQNHEIGRASCRERV